MSVSNAERVAVLTAKSGLALAAAAFLLSLPFNAAAQAERPGSVAAEQAQAQARSVGDDPLRTRAAATGGGLTQFGSGEGAGAMDQKASGFAPSIWRDSKPEVLGELLRSLPVETRSSAVHDIARRLLATAAAPPTSHPGFLRVRVATLMAMGELQNVADMARAAGSAADEETSRMAVDAQFAIGRTEAACLDTLAVGPRNGGEYWNRALTFCRGLLGQGGGESLPYGQELRTQAARDSAIARNPKQPFDQRLAAAVRGAHVNAVPASLLAELFKRAGRGDRGAALGAEGGLPEDTAGAVALWHAINDVKDPSAKAELLRHVLNRAERIDNYVVSLVDTFRAAPMMFEPKPTGPDDPAFARPSDVARGVANIVARGFFTAGDSAMGEEWAKTGKGQPYAEQVAPFLAAIGGEAARKNAQFDQPLVRAALRALDRGSAGRSDVNTEGYLPPIAELAALDESAQAGRLGETVLRALIVLGPEGPAKASPLAVNRAVAALRAINQRDEAEAIAFEAIAAGMRGK
jgi:hypothetical protein